MYSMEMGKKISFTTVCKYGKLDGILEQKKWQLKTKEIELTMDVSK